MGGEDCEIGEGLRTCDGSEISICTKNQSAPHTKENKCNAAGEPCDDDESCCDDMSCTNGVFKGEDCDLAIAFDGDECGGSEQSVCTLHNGRQRLDQEQNNNTNQMHSKNDKTKILEKQNSDEDFVAGLRLLQNFDHAVHSSEEKGKSEHHVNGVDQSTRNKKSRKNEKTEKDQDFLAGLKLLENLRKIY